jgi:hypothetical protein
MLFQFLAQFHSLEGLCAVIVQGLERAGAEFSKPWNFGQVSPGVQRGQRREQQGGEECEGGFHWRGDSSSHQCSTLVWASL